MFHGIEGHGWGMSWVWLVGFILFVIIIWIIVKSINQYNKSNGAGNKTPIDILKERYAKGEIDKQEFEEKKRDLI